MAITSRADYPNNFCCDCGQKGCVMRHRGPLVPDQKPHSFCVLCWFKRQGYYMINNIAKPLPENHVCKYGGTKWNALADVQSLYRRWAGAILKMKPRNIKCAVCGGQTGRFHKDRRLASCKHCNLARCGRCGDTLMIKYSIPAQFVDLFEWVVPKKILEYILEARQFCRCEKCGWKYPFKRDIFRYIFWELKAVFSKP